jgi:hypothetical protein
VRQYIFPSAARCVVPQPSGASRFDRAMQCPPPGSSAMLAQSLDVNEEDLAKSEPELLRKAFPWCGE